MATAQATMAKRATETETTEAGEVAHPYPTEAAPSMSAVVQNPAS